jgi:hypothetical protein
MNTDMKKQTAVEWLVSKLSITFQTMYSEEIEQAKAMEREQIVAAHDAARDDHYQMYFSEEYYTKTYGGDE